MVYGLFILGAIILIVMAIAIRRDLAQIEVQAKRVAVVPEAIFEPEPVISFEEDREITGQLLPITEHHCRASGGRGKRKDWKKKPKGKGNGKRREVGIGDEVW